MMTVYMVSRKTQESTEYLRDLAFGKLADLRQRGIIGYNPVPKILFADLSMTTMLGYYERKQDLIVLDEGLLDTQETLENVFLHELAHYVDTVLNSDSRHDMTFRNICLALGCEEEFSHAKVAAERRKREDRRAKIEKLMALSQSDFRCESESAMLKARQLMEKWDISVEDEEDRIYGVQMSEAGKREAYVSHLGYAVSRITGAFPVFVGKNIHFFGTRTQVEAAMYVYDSLMQTIGKRTEQIIERMKNPVCAFTSENEQPTFGEYIAFLDSQKKKKGPAPRISRAQIKDGIVLGFQKKLRETESREIVLRVQNNEQKYKRISEARLTKGHTRTTRSEGFYNGYREGLKLEVPSGRGQDMTRRLEAS